MKCVSHASRISCFLKLVVVFFIISQLFPPCDFASSLTVCFFHLSRSRLFLSFIFISRMTSLVLLLLTFPSRVTMPVFILIVDFSFISFFLFLSCSCGCAFSFIRRLVLSSYEIRDGTLSSLTSRRANSLPVTGSV